MEYLQYEEKESSIPVTLLEVVLNLIINGIPSILCYGINISWSIKVLNLIINGIPSIPIPHELVTQAKTMF